jgi:hypothetical protein
MLSSPKKMVVNPETAKYIIGQTPEVVHILEPTPVSPPRDRPDPTAKLIKEMEHKMERLTGSKISELPVIVQDPPPV